MEKQIEVSNCACGCANIEIIYVPAGVLSGRKASCVIRCVKCGFTVSSNDLSVVSSKRLGVFWNDLQRVKSSKELWREATEVPPQDERTISFESSLGGFLIGNFLGVVEGKLCVKSNGDIFKIDPCRWCLYADFTRVAFENKEEKK